PARLPDRLHRGGECLPGDRRDDLQRGSDWRSRGGARQRRRPRQHGAARGRHRTDRLDRGRRPRRGPAPGRARAHLGDPGAARLPPHRLRPGARPRRPDDHARADAPLRQGAGGAPRRSHPRRHERRMTASPPAVLVRTPSHRAAWLLGPVLALALLPSNVVATALPLLRGEWHATATEMGIVFAAYQVGYVAAVLLVLPLTDRVAAGRVIAACFAATAAAFLLFPLGAHGVWSAAALRVLAG